MINETQKQLLENQLLRADIAFIKSILKECDELLALLQIAENLSTQLDMKQRFTYVVKRFGAGFILSCRIQKSILSTFRSNIEKLKSKLEGL